MHRIDFEGLFSNYSWDLSLAATPTCWLEDCKEDLGKGSLSTCTCYGLMIKFVALFSLSSRITLAASIHVLDSSARFEFSTNLLDIYAICGFISWIMLFVLLIMHVFLLSGTVWSIILVIIEEWASLRFDSY